MSVKVDIASLDLYDILEVRETADEQEIKKAYRKKALKCHPDKNPDDPKASEQFHILSKVLEVLLDSVARKAYDKVLRSKSEAKKRSKQLDAKRQKLKDDLEARERQSEEGKKVVKLTSEQEADRLKKEIERLRKEGSKQLEEEQEFVRQEILREKRKASVPHEVISNSCRIKAKWKGSGLSEYNEETIRQIFSKYGNISCLVISGKKKGSALIEFKDSRAALLAKEIERGFGNNPLSVELLSEMISENSVERTREPEPKNDHLDDYEEQIFRVMRQAQQKKAAENSAEPEI